MCKHLQSNSKLMNNAEPPAHVFWASLCVVGPIHVPEPATITLAAIVLLLFAARVVFVHHRQLVRWFRTSGAAKTCVKSSGIGVPKEQ